MKPLTFIFGSKQFAPGTPAWTKVNKMLADGKTPNQVFKEQVGLGNNIIGSAQKSANAAMAGRNGLMAAAVSSYMNEADQIYPTDNEVPVIEPKSIEQMAPAQAQQQSMVSPERGLAAIQQIASMLQPVQNVGVSSLEEGAEIARSVA